MPDRAQKITFAEMRDMGVRGRGDTYYGVAGTRTLN